jgi:hypothetical protein
MMVGSQVLEYYLRHRSLTWPKTMEGVRCHERAYSGSPVFACHLMVRHTGCLSSVSTADGSLVVGVAGFKKYSHTKFPLDAGPTSPAVASRRTIR